MKKLIFASVLVISCACTMSARGAVRVWDGGGADDNLSTPANWVGDVAPASGDVLVFKGTVRRTPVNDYNPSTTTFNALIFSNTTANVGFTLSGNRIRLNGCSITGLNNGYSFAIYPAPATGSLTDTLDLEVELRNSSRVGSWTGSNHHLTFKKKVTGGGGALMSNDQYKGMLTFEGPVENFSHVHRPNGYGGIICLKSNENVFSASTAHAISEGVLNVAGVDAYGGASRGIVMGQASWKTPASLQIAAATDSVFDMPITVRGPSIESVGGMVENCTPGTTVTLAGTVTAQSNLQAGQGNGDGTRFGLGGAGDGVFAGTLATSAMGLQKQGAGTWTLAPESSGSATSGVWVTAGTLVVDGDWTSMQKVSVSANAVLGGTGAVASVAFANGAGLRFTGDLTGYRTLSIAGRVSFAGKVKVTSTAQPSLTPGVLYPILTLPAGYTGTPSFEVGTGFSESTTFIWEGNTLKMSISSSELVWRGGLADNVWDTTTANWQGNLLFTDGSGVTFDDSAAVAGTVRIPAPVSPHAVTVGGANAYTFTGAGFTGVCALQKVTGTSTLTLANTNSHTGTTRVEAGSLILSGVLDGSPLTVSGATTVFTNTPTGRISGSGYVNISGAACELAGANDFTGGLTLTASSTEVPASVKYVVRRPEALGAGDVTLTRGAVRFPGSSGSVGRGRTLSLTTGGTTYLYLDSGVTFGWLGNVEISNSQLLLRPDGTLNFGEFGCSTVVHSTGGAINVRQNGIVNWYSRLDVKAFEQTDYNANHFYAPGNSWSALSIKAGSVVCHTNDTLAYASVTLGQTYESYTFNPVLNLNGFDQTISALLLQPAIARSTETVTSATPATLTISNNTDFVTSNQQLQFTGMVTLRKRGTGSWTLHGSNRSTGNVLVEDGMFVAATNDVFPTNSADSCLMILPTARVVLTNGVNATVSRLSNGHVELPAGLYGGEGCTAAGAHIRPTMFGAGTGSLRVLHGSGMTLILR